jgi:peptide/nickel transport system substrate-binding protein
MMRAIDRKLVIEGAFSGFGTPIGSHYAPSDAGYVDTTGVLPFDPAKAKALLAEAGYPNGFTVTIKTPQMAETTRTAEMLQAMLADVGITLTIVPSEFPAKWIDDVFLKKDYDVTIIDHAEPNDIDIYARPNYYFNYHDPEFDAVIDKAKIAQDPAARNALLAQAQRILATAVPALYLFDLPRLGIVDAHVRGLWPDEPLPQMIVKAAFWGE